MPNRIIHSHGGSQSLIDYLVSLLTLEALSPGKEIYLISPYLSNAPIIDNKYGQYSDVFPFCKGKTIRLSDVIETIAWRGAEVRIICDPNRPETQPFIRLIGDTASFKILEHNHEKGLCSENFYLSGSMNFTYRGIHHNREKIRITTEADEISQALIAFRHRWEEAVSI